MLLIIFLFFTWIIFDFYAEPIRGIFAQYVMLFAAVIKEVISETGAQSMRDIGKVMAAVRPKTKGRADGKQINAIAKELLS